MKRRVTCLLTAALAVISLCLSIVPATAAQTNSAPIAENMELQTFRGVSVGGQLSAVDPDGDLVTFTLTTPPCKGELALSEDGSFVYAPLEGKKGKDYFGFRAVDSQGNVSQESTVIIRIEKQKTTVSYADMGDSPSHYAALAMAESDIFVGERLGGSYIFNPGQEVSRGEFLAMCMKMADTKLLSGVSTTGFSDDVAIPVWIKPYVSTALMTGVISGYSDNGEAVFDASAPVSFSEAAVILDRVLNVANVSTTGARVGTAPVWAYQSVANMTAVDVLPSNYSVMESSLTREDAAGMLLKAMDVIRNR